MQVPWEKKYLAGWGYMLSHDVAFYIVASALRWERHPHEAPGWYAGAGPAPGLQQACMHASCAAEGPLVRRMCSRATHSHGLTWCRAALGGCHGRAYCRAAGGR